MTGLALECTTEGGFTFPLTYTYGVAGTYSGILIPIGAVLLVAEAWGSTGGGGAGHGSGCAAGDGGSSASGGYARTSIAAVGGQTINVVIGAKGIGVSHAAGTTGGVTTITAGTFAIATMTANPGTGGLYLSPYSGGTGGTATGGTVVNTSGNNGGASGGAPGAGIVGVNGTGRNGSVGGYSAAQPGADGRDGLVILKFT